MENKEAIIKLLILLSVSNHELHNEERKYIDKAIEDLRMKIDIDEALDEMNTKFRDDFDTACNFYLESISGKNEKEITLNYMRELADADLIVRDREKKFLELCKKNWPDVV